MFWGPGAGAQLDPGPASGSSSEDDRHANGFGGDGRRARDPAVGLPVRTEAAECGACWVTRLSQARHYSALISMANKKGTYPGTGTWALYHVPGDYDSDCHVVHGSMLLLSIP